MREIKFRLWDGIRMVDSDFVHGSLNENLKSVSKDIMQYIGYKDRNGREIYEGDIVKVPKIKQAQLIGYDSGWVSYCFVYDTGEIMRRITPRELHDMQIIGNIYENPELLATPKE